MRDVPSHHLGTAKLKGPWLNLQELNHNSHANFTVKFFSSENGGSGLTLGQRVLLHTSTIFPKDQETLDLIDVVVDHDDPGYVNVFLFSPEPGTFSKNLLNTEDAV